MTFKSISVNYYNEGLKLFKNKELSAALPLLKKSVQFDENNWTYYNALGLCLYNIGDFNEARTAWVESINIFSLEENPAKGYLSTLEDEDFIEVIKKYEQIYELMNLGNKLEIGKILSNTELLEHNILKLQNFYGLCFYALGDKNSAVKHWKNALEIDKNNTEALLYLSEAYELQVQRKGLMGFLKKILGM